jgi:hypothetical protein
VTVRQTFEGIDLCGKRLAEEVREYVNQTPGLERISVIGHSMGGLISRYVIGAPRTVLHEDLVAVARGMRMQHMWQPPAPLSSGLPNVSRHPMSMGCLPVGVHAPKCGMANFVN